MLVRFSSVYLPFRYLRSLWKGKEMKIFNLIIISRSKYINDLSESFNAGWNGCEKIKDEEALTVNNPVIHDLEKLRADTWNQDKITYMQNWLKNNFEGK